MTPQDRNRVLVACGWHVEQGCVINLKGEYWQGPTQQELWETLCRVCFGWLTPVLRGNERVEIEYGYDVPIVYRFFVDDEGSLTAAIEEAILWVLNQKESEEQ